MHETITLMQSSFFQKLVTSGNLEPSLLYLVCTASFAGGGAVLHVRMQADSEKTPLH